MLPFVFIGLLLCFLGAYIWRNEAIWLLSNFSEENTNDKKGLAKWAGKWILAMGALGIINGLLIYFWKEEEGVFVAIFAVGTLVMCVFYLVGGQKYVKK